MRKIVSIIIGLAILAGFAQAATVTWDGGGGNSFFTTANNWFDDVAPADTDDVVVDANTNLRGAGNWILDIDGGAAKSLTLDPTWTGGKIGMRGDAAMDIANNGAITITSNYTDNSSATFGNSLGGNLTLRSIVNNGTLNFVNNSAKEVSFVGGAGGNVVQLRGRAGNETTAFGGTGDFLLGTDVTLLILERIWTDAAFCGTLTLNGDAGFMNPTTDLRINGGTIKIGANEQIGDSTTVAFGTDSGITGVLDAVGITETAGTVNNFSAADAILGLQVDGSTDLTFANFNDGGQDRGDINITGWDEETSSIVFTSLSAYDWPVGEGEAFANLTINGGMAFMTAVSNGWAVSAFDLLIESETSSLGGNDLLDDTRPFVMDNGTLNLAGYSDTVGTLTLSSSSTIDLSSGGSIAFANSTNQNWTGTLSITGTLTPTSIRFGTDANGLSADQLRTIPIGDDYAWLDANGYLQRLIATSGEVSGDNSGNDYRIVGGGQLGGTGTVGSIDAAPLAQVSPGTSGTPIAKLNVAGDVDMALSTELRIDATRSSGTFSNDLVASSGSVTFSGTIDLFLDGEPLQAGDEITVLTGSVPLRSYLDIPARIVVDPASPTPLPAGLELNVVYYSNKITVLVQNVTPNPFGALNEGDFDHGMFFWNLDGPDNGADIDFSLDASDPQAGRNSLKITVNTAGTAPEDLELYQSFHVRPVTNAESYTVSFKIKTDVVDPATVFWGVGGIEYVYPGYEFGRRFGTEPFPDVDGFTESFSLSSADGWKTVSRTFYPVNRDAAVVAISLGNLPNGHYWIDDVQVDGPVPPPAPDFKVVGYYPAYRLGSVPISIFGHVDVLNYSSVMSDTDGSILPYYQTSTAGVRYYFFKDITDNDGDTISVEDHLQEIKNTWNLELIITVIGKKDTDRADGFIEMLTTQTTRETFADNLVQFCLDHGFDGVDLNFEWPSSSYNLNLVSEQQNYRYFVEYLRSALDVHGFSLSQAPGLFGPAYYDPDTYWRMDRNGHQGYAKDDATHIANIFKAYTVGMPLHTLFPGIIFAAEPSSGGDDITYRTLYSNLFPEIARHETVAGGYLFNGMDSVRQKIQIARRLGCAGVMIWELGQDTIETHASLIKNALQDSDADGLLDRWEDQFDSVNLRPEQDDDNDGILNIDESVADTDPTDQNSKLEMTSIVQSNGMLNIGWAGGVRAEQVLQTCDPSALSNGWNDLFTNTVPTSTQESHPVPNDADSRWYRIRAHRP